MKDTIFLHECIPEGVRNVNGIQVIKVTYTTGMKYYCRFLLILVDIKRKWYSYPIKVTYTTGTRYDCRFLLILIDMKRRRYFYSIFLVMLGH